MGDGGSSWSAAGQPIPDSSPGHVAAVARAFAYLLVALAGYVAARSLPHLL
jgi:hypothetical protein